MIYNNLKQLKQDLPFRGRLLGLDVGTKNIGVAVCDGDWLVANPRLTISRKGGKADFFAIKEAIEENKIVAIVVGLPLHMDGTESEMSKLIRRFATGLDEFLGSAKIVFFDERLSSFAAEELLESGKVKNNKRKGKIDQIAASVILQGVVDEMNV